MEDMFYKNKRMHQENYRIWESRIEHRRKARGIPRMMVKWQQFIIYKEQAVPFGADEGIRIGSFQGINGPDRLFNVIDHVKKSFTDFWKIF